jgi:hypothetical protein
VVLQKISLGWGRKFSISFFFAKVFAKCNLRFREKKSWRNYETFAKVFAKNYFFLLEPLRFGSNQMRLSAAPVLSKAAIIVTDCITSSL